MRWAPLMVRAGADLLREADWLVPVPLHRHRMLSRRYNQAALLARAVSRLSGRPTLLDALRRVKATSPLAELSPARRAAEMADAVSVRASRRLMLADSRVLLIDDVLTSGATARACVGALKEAGGGAGRRAGGGAGAFAAMGRQREALEASAISDPAKDVMTIEIYTQPWCPYCERAMALFDGKGVDYREINAPNGSEARQQSIQRSGRSSVPQIFIDGRHVGGCDDLVALDRAGQLDTLLKAA